MTLNGTWKLYYFPEGSCSIERTEDLKNAGVPSVPCTVPGNVELDLSAAGVLPADLFKGENILQAEQYETYEWWYETAFVPEAPAEGKKVILHFGAVDCFADYYLNGEKIASSDNMFISQDFDVTKLLRYGVENTLHVNIHSPVVRGAEYDNEMNVSLFRWGNPLISDWVRKAPHSYGWDIMPRALSAGIWRDVELRYENVYDFKFCHMELRSLHGKNGEIAMVYDTTVPPQYIFTSLGRTLRFEIQGKCGEHTFSHTAYPNTKYGKITFRVEDIQLWWPKNYGEPNMYDITVEVFTPDGELLMRREFAQGFRTLKLNRTDIVDREKGCFEFIINGVKIMAVGSNWVPMDVYHSRDKERYQRALALADEIGCNILRCWGGNVYEDHAFFDFCDRHGIMVWQDFAMACAFYPQTHEFADRIEKEAEWVVRELRDHVSLVLWCGDNENDCMMAGHGVNPKVNYLTREVLPRVIERLDPCRPYIASSPYISDEAFALGSAYYPEDHLWGPRDYFKSTFYTGSNAYFVSETGYHGCPSRKSIERFIDAEYVWPYHDNRQWNLHSSDQNNRDNRTLLMEKQVRQLFGEVPTDMDEYILASQISQAEAKKFFIERVRAKMDRMGGVIWWNLIDGWPQMSDAVVDYYYEKKLAYHYIRRSSRPFIIMLDEMTAWGHNVICANSTLKAVTGTCRISDLDSGRVVFEKAFSAAPNANTNLGRLDCMYSEQGMFLIEWEVDGKTFYNTYLYGTPVFSLEQYKSWLDKLAALGE